MSSRTSGGPEATNKVPDRVIDAPEDEDRREFLATLKDSSPAVLKAIAVFHRKRAMVAEAKCARLEAEKQEAQTEGWNAAIDAAAKACRDEDYVPGAAEHFGVMDCIEAVQKLLKPTAAKQGGVCEECGHAWDVHGDGMEPACGWETCLCKVFRSANRVEGRQG